MLASNSLENEGADIKGSTDMKTVFSRFAHGEEVGRPDVPPEEMIDPRALVIGGKGCP